MSSRVIVFLGLFLAMILFISSQVTATQPEETFGAATNDAKYSDNYGGGYGSGGRGGGYGGGGYGGGGYGGGGGGRGVHCGGYGCCRCCSYAGQKADFEHHTEPHN